MNVKRLSIVNIRKLQDVVIDFNKPLIAIFGDTMQGKTTVLDCIKILFSKGFPADLITHGQTEASIELELENGNISRSFYINKSGEIVGRNLEAFVNNKKMSATDLKKLFNPFQFDQDFLKNMTPTERKTYFIDLFGVNTLEFDERIKKGTDYRTMLKDKLKSFGEIDTTEVKPVNLIELENVKKGITEKMQREKDENDKANAKIRANWKVENEKHLSEIQKFNDEQAKLVRFLKTAADLSNKITESLFNFTAHSKVDIGNEDINLKLDEYFSKLQKPQTQKPLTNLEEYEPIKLIVNTSELDAINLKIQNAKAEEILHTQYLKRVEDQKEKDKVIAEIKKADALLAAIKKDKIQKLKEFGKEIKGLEFDENGDLKFEGFTNDNLSTSQIVRLGSLLTKLYPESLLALEILDRGESLGFASQKNGAEKIQHYVNKAITDKTTILVTVVGEEPAGISEDVGVFVIEDGKII